MKRPCVEKKKIFPALDAGAPIKITLDFASAPFPASLVTLLGQQGFPSPSAVQGAAWPLAAEVGPSPAVSLVSPLQAYRCLVSLSPPLPAYIGMPAYIGLPSVPPRLPCLPPPPLPPPAAWQILL